jgi:hypothetical protein
MNKQRIHAIIQYALLAAGQEDDFYDRELGPIHLIKYVYLADLNHAKHNNGETYTGIRWRFHHFGPWSNDVNDCIEPALEEIGANCKILPSQFDDSNDYKRWTLSDDHLLEKLGVKLPITISGVVASSVHKFKNDTPSLLEHVYRTVPMRRAAPGEFLDFSPVTPEKREKVNNLSKWGALSAKKKKKFKQALNAIRNRQKPIKKPEEYEFVQPPVIVVDDKTYAEGLSWVESLAGEPIAQGKHEAYFTDSVWHSKTREGDFPE